MSAGVDFGIFTPLAGMDFPSLRERARLAEELGYHSLWVTDHMWNRVRPELDCYEALAALAALAPLTSRLRLGALVICNNFRNPALLAKSLSAIDHISGGRLEVGMGAGWMEEEHRAYGFDFPPIAERLARLEESILILKAMFTQDRATFRGRYYTVDEARNNPKPIQRPHPPLTIGGGGEKRMLRLVAKHADRWNCPAGYRSLAQKIEVLKNHCRAVGRDFASLRLSEQLLVCIGRDAGEVAAKWKFAQRLTPFSRTGIKGTPDEVIAQLKTRVAQGMTLFTVLFGDYGPPDTLELFARKVMPAFNQAG